MSRWWQVSWKRVGITLLCCFAAAPVLEWAGTDAVVLYFARQTIQEHPNLSIVPTPVPDKNIEMPNGITINRFEFSFQVPWEEIEYEKNGKTVSLLDFKNGGTIIIFDPSIALDRAKSIQEAAKTTHDAKVIRQVYGSRALSSNYDFMASELATSPSHVKWWASKTSNVKSVVLLNLKTTEILDSNAIYQLSNNEMHGFQFGNPAVVPYRIELNLFDRNDRRYHIIISSRDKQLLFYRSQISTRW